MAESIKTVFFGGHGFLGKNCDLKAIRPTSQECDLLNYESTFSYLQKYRGQNIKIVNAAAKVAGFTYNKSRNVEMLWNNATMALNLMRAIKEWHLDCYYLYVSSVCGYKDGNSQENQYFDGIPGVNNYGYGMSKRLGVSAIESLKLDMGDRIKTCCLIPTNLFGPWDQFSDETSHVIPALIKKIQRPGGMIEILGNASNERDFLYVGDLGKVIEKCVIRQITGTYNVSSEAPISISDLVQELIGVFGGQGKVVRENFDGIPEKRRVDSSKLKNVMPDFSLTSLRDGLILTKKWLNGTP